MKIHTLGTSHGDSTILRFNSSTAYETDDGSIYLVDAGAPVEALLRRKALEVKNLRAVFVTHMHDDHTGGLTGLMKQTVKYPTGRTAPLAIYLPEEAAIAPLKAWFYAVHEKADHEMLAYHAVTDGDFFEDENIKISAIRTCHLRTKGRFEGDPCSFAYTLYFKKEDLSVLHTGDLNPKLVDFPEIASKQHFDVCLFEAAHYQPQDALDKLMAAKFDRLILIHLGIRWQTYVKERWNVENGEKELLQAFQDLPYPICIANDGDTFWY